MPISRISKTLLFLQLLFACLFLLVACETPEEVAENHLQKGKELFEKGEYDKAILELKTSNQSGDRRGETYYYMALLDEKGLHYKSMRENLLKTIELDPNNLEARQKLGKVHLLFGDVDKTLEQADFLLGINSNDEAAKLLKASAYIRQDKKDQAIKIVDDVLETNPDSIEALSVRAAIYFENEQFDQALSAADLALTKDTKNMPLRLFKIKIYAKQNNIDAVVNEYKTLIEIYPDSDSLKLKLASLYSMTDKLQSAEDLLRSIVVKNPDKLEPKLVLLEFLNAKIKESVVNEFNSMLAGSNKNALLMLELSKWMLGAGYLEAASSGLGQVVDIEKDSKTGLAAKTVLAEIALNDKQYDKAEESINNILQADSEFVDASLLKAQLFLMTNKVDEAIDLLNKVIWTKNDSDNVYMLLGQAYASKKDQKQADKYFKQALEINPANIKAFLPVYRAYLIAGQKEMARQYLDKALKAKPNQLLLLTTKAELDISEKKWDEAQEIVQKIGLLSKNKVVPLYLQANILQGTEKYDAAIKIYEKVLASHPDHLNSLVNLVRSYEGLDRRDQALAFLEDYQAKHKESLAIVGVLSDLYLANKDYAKAKQLLANQIKQFPNMSVPLYLALAKVEASSEKSIEAAKKVYLAGLQANPDNLQLSLALAGLYQKIADKSAAQKIYERVIEKYPNDNLAINNLATILIESDNPEQMASGLVLAKRFKDSDNVYMQDTYAWGLVKNGNNAEGLTILESLIVKEPKVPELRYHLGVAHLNDGNKATAIVELKQAISLADKEQRSFAGKDEASRLLKQLE